MSLSWDEYNCGFVTWASKSEEGGALSAEAFKQLREDADALGLIGLMVSGAYPEDPPQVDQEVRTELADTLVADIKDSLGVSEDLPLDALFDQYVAAKGERGPDLLARLVSRVVYELYDLRDHGLMQDDALAACELIAWSGPLQDARETVRRIIRLSRLACRNTLGHMDNQLELVHLLSNPEMPIVYSDIDRRVSEFAPRVFSQRLPSLTRALLLDDKRFRLCFVLWARMRGLVLGRAQLVELANRIEPKRPMLLIQALEESKQARAVIRKACEDNPLALRIEQTFLARTL